MISLTKRQSDALAFIRSFIAEHGYRPSYREIASAVGASIGHIDELLDDLSSLDCIRRLRNRARAIEVLPPRFKFIPASEVYDNAALLAGRG